jgi:hypothetical protein
MTLTADLGVGFAGWARTFHPSHHEERLPPTLHILGA